jgi:hypothetical protein
MTTVTTGMFFLARQRPVADRAQDGAFRLTMRVKDNQGQFRVEPYLVTWTGEAAQAWWEAHQAALAPGRALRMELHNPRAAAPSQAAAEIHALVARCELLPVAPSWRGREDASPQPSAASAA